MKLRKINFDFPTFFAACQIIPLENDGNVAKALNLHNLSTFLFQFMLLRIIFRIFVEALISKQPNTKYPTRTLNCDAKERFQYHPWP